MKCPGCGASYDPQFKFCPFCGRAKPESDTLRIKVEEASYEICTIEIVEHGGLYNIGQRLFGAITKGCIEAVAVGPEGRYVAGTVDGIWINNQTGGNVHGNDKRLDILIKQLVSDGWEPMGHGVTWYGYQFRRRVDVLPEDIVCPNCGTPLTLEGAERISGQFTCPECEKAIDMKYERSSS